jgi:hypothetical protein
MAQPISHLPIQGSGGSNPVDQLARNALNKITSFSFSVSPLSVPVNSGVTASWHVVLPVVEGFTFVIKLNGMAVAATGTQTFLVNYTETFTLTASVTIDPTVARTLGAKTVQVSTSDCQTMTVSSALITIPIESQLQQAFASSSQITLKSGVSVVAGTGVINISAPLNINVPDWFDADMTIAIQIDISGGSSVLVSAPTVNVQVSWGLASNLLSLGCTDLVGSGMTQIAQVLFAHIVNAEIVGPIQSGLSGQVTSFINGLEQSDAQHRTFVMHTLTFDANNVTVTACPSV